MAQELINKIKDFNSPTITEELAAISGLPAMTTQYAGFEFFDLQRLRPFTEATRAIARNTDGSVDTAARGDIRFDTRNPLTAGQVADIEAVLDAHDATVDHSSQTSERQRIADQAELRALFDAGIADRTEELTVKLLLGELGEDV